MNTPLSRKPFIEETPLSACQYVKCDGDLVGPCGRLGRATRRNVRHAFLIFAMLASLFVNLPRCVSQQAENPDEIQTLIRQLESGPNEQRESAVEALIARGAAVVEHLPEVDDRTSEELRLRLMRIRDAVSMSNTVSPARSITASTVTLAGRMPLSAILSAFEQQTKNRITDLRAEYGGEMGDPEVDVDFDEVRYLEALDIVLDRAGLKISSFSGDAGTLGIVNRDDGELPAAGSVAYHSVFRLRPTRVEAVRELGNPNNHLMRLDLTIAWEPNHVPMTFRFDPAGIEATLDDGSTAKLQERFQAFNLPVQEAVSGVELNLPFELPSRDAGKISKLTTTCIANLPGAEQELEFVDLASRATVHRAGSLTVSVERARRDGPIVDIVLAFKFNAPDDPLSTYRGWIFQRPARMLDAVGAEHEYVGLETMFQRDASMAVAYKFEVGGSLENMKLIVNVPASVTAQELSFELTGIDLP